MTSLALIVSSPDSPGTHEDHEVPAVTKALREVGIEVTVTPWTAELDWARHDAVLLKSPWDYSMRAAEFVAWLSALEGRTRVLNPISLVRWNFDKRYLLQLASRGVQVTPFVCTDEGSDVHRLVAASGPKVVVKPTVSAGSRNTGLFDRDDPRCVELAMSILSQGKVAMIMPALPSVAEHGETALLFFGGQLSHAVEKGPILAEGGGYLGGAYRESLRLTDPRADEVELGLLCLRTIAELVEDDGRPTEPLYARIDVARDVTDKPCILEAELFEPSYFTHLDPGASARFAQALSRRLASGA